MLIQMKAMPLLKAGGGAAAFSTIYTAVTPDNSNDMGFDGYTLRTVTGAISKSITQVRVTLKPNPTGGSNGVFRVNNGAIGVKGAGAFQTTATPVELKLAGASGWNLAAGSAAVVTDVALLTANSGDRLVIIFDFFVTGSTNGINYHIGANGDGGYKNNTASYQDPNPASMVSGSYMGAGYSIVEGA